MMEAHVRATADSVFVTSHDGKTDRLGGKMKIANSTIAELRTERYTQTRDSATYEGSGICTVGEFLDICKENGVAPLLHLKTFSRIRKIADISRHSQSLSQRKVLPATAPY